MCCPLAENPDCQKISPVHLPGRFLVPNKNVNPFQITEHESSCVEVKSSWPGGYDANLLFKSTVEVDHWNAQVIFNARFDKIDIFNGADVQCSSSMCTFSDLGWWVVKLNQITWASSIMLFNVLCHLLGMVTSARVKLRGWVSTSTLKLMEVSQKLLAWW